MIAVDLEGRIVHSLQDDDRRFLATTTALQHDGYLYLGSVVMDAVGRLPLPDGGETGRGARERTSPDATGAR